MGDFQYAPFNQQGGLGKAYELFGDELPGTARRAQPGVGSVGGTCGALSSIANMTVEGPTISSHNEENDKGEVVDDHRR